MLPQLPNRIACVAVDGLDVTSDIVDFVRLLRDDDFTVILARSHESPRSSDQDRLLADPLVTMMDCEVQGVFGLWQAALESISLQLADTKSLLLLSTRLVVRPDAKPRFQRLLGHVTEFAAVDLWGLTESWVGQYHLPACFLSAGPRAFFHPAWTAFWSALAASRSRAKVAHKIEIDLTQSLLAAGLNLSAIFPYEALLDQVGAAFAALRHTPPTSDSERARAAHLRRVRTLQANRTPMEPLNFFWQELLELGSPFIARELLSRNPHGILTAAYSAQRFEEIIS